MTINLQVSDVRDQIDQRAGIRSSVSVASRLFNETLVDLLGSDRTLNLHAAIEEVEPTLENWHRALIGHTYHRLVGPRLLRQQARLHHLSDQILTLWDAVQELCGWLAGLLIEAYENGDEELSGFEWRRIADPVSLELDRQRLAQASEPVTIGGQPDQVWQSPLNGQWVMIALRTDQTSPLADLLEASLTHLLLQAAGESLDAPRALRRISFTPTREEQVYGNPELLAAREQLLELISARRRPRRESVLAETAATDSATLGDRLIALLREDGLTARLDPPVLAAPAFLRFPVIVGERWRGRSAARLAREIQVRLKLDAPPQLSAEGQRLLIDLPRPDRQTITLAAVLDQVPVGDPLVGAAHAPLGVDLAGQLRLIDFSQPEDAHLLIAGAVGSGKSSWLRAALAGLRHSNTPTTLRLILVDPGGRTFVEPSLSPYLLEPVIGADGPAVARALAALGAEMERRYQLMEERGVDSLAALASVTGSPVPRIFFVCDEYADLILHDRPTRLSIETEISRLGQRARQAGIHLILATSQPGREIIRGVVDANFPARIGLRMNKAIESKIVLNQPGAETLLGDGDLLFRDIGELTRLQGIWIDPDAIQTRYQ